MKLARLLATHHNEDANVARTQVGHEGNVVIVPVYWRRRTVIRLVSIIYFIAVCTQKRDNQPPAASMPPKESDRLLNQKHDEDAAHPHHAPPLFLSMRSSSTLMEEGGLFSENNKKKRRYFCLGGSCYLTVAMIAIAATLGVFASRAFLKHFGDGGAGNNKPQARTGPYQLTELQVGKKLFDFYEFYEGADSLGSAGYNTYTAEKRALALGLLNVTQEQGGDEVVYLNTLPTEQGPRESVRLEGLRRFDAGLFILDIDHMPAGCGQWPAFWLTDEDYWPDHGEIDIVEGVNYQTQAKTALHTSDRCSMYAHVADYSFSGHWDRATGIPDTFTGAMDTQTSVPADNVSAVQ